MAKIYFAKMNINDEIFEVYKGEKELSSLLKKIYEKINNEDELYDEYGGRYKFFDLDKVVDDNTKGSLQILGRLGYIKKGVHSSYDPENDTAIDLEDKNKLEYVTFYFDVDRELIAFNSKIGLNRYKFVEIFPALIKKSSDIGVQLMTETNFEELKLQIGRIKTLKRINLKLVPPNGDKREFADLYSLDADKYQEANITNITQSLSTQTKRGLNKDSEAIKNVIKGIGLGYAEGRFIGKDSSNEDLEVDSSEEVPYTKTLSKNSTNDKQTIFTKGKAGFMNLLTRKAHIREKGNDDRK
ncbi:hypothetical protein [Listeria booriae]|uniref:hypothetical protein n=1 Tax=Listeria booriae TaxID=1552123 RepID=UPI0016249C6A|nr:hypothetical protein [Listeria booriae]MBC2258364.1 hypothetical protein [Listeria booriae]